MPDMSEFDAWNTPSVPKSKVNIILEELEGTDRGEALHAALNDPSYSGTAITRVLRSWGYAISFDSVQKWRKRQ